MLLLRLYCIHFYALNFWTIENRRAKEKWSSPSKTWWSAVCRDKREREALRRAHRFSNLGGREGDGVSDIRGRLGFGMCTRSSGHASWWMLLLFCDFVCMCVWLLSAQLCFTLCDPMDHSLPDSSVHGIIPAGILEWVAIFSFRISSWPKDQTHISWGSCIGRQILYHWATWEILCVFV